VEGGDPCGNDDGRNAGQSNEGAFQYLKEMGRRIDIGKTPGKVNPRFYAAKEKLVGDSNHPELGAVTAEDLAIPIRAHFEIRENPGFVIAEAVILAAANGNGVSWSLIAK
jgi:hypothetical protein